MKNNFLKNGFIPELVSRNKGFSVLEILVVISIFSIALVGISSLMLQTMQAESLNAGYLKASMLSQEGLEVVRAFRDENWLDPSIPAWDKNLFDETNSTDRTFTVDYAGNINYTPDNINDADTQVRLNAGFYEHLAGTPTSYRRLITVTECGADCREIESKVEWVASGKTNSYVAQTVLYNWR